MTYNPNAPRIVIRRNMNNTYNVVEEKRGKSGKILASFPTREQAKEYIKKRIP